MSDINVRYVIKRVKNMMRSGYGAIYELGLNSEDEHQAIEALKKLFGILWLPH